jgi:HD-GYP domain-containing protein (c-di-GMP phosphodiesterase class II)
MNAPLKPGARPQRNVGTAVFVGFVTVVAAALMVTGAITVGPPDEWWALVVLTAMGILSWVLRQADVNPRVNISFVNIILLAAAVIVGPLGAAIVGLIASAVQGERAPAVVRVFNISLASVLGSVGGFVYLLAGGARDVGQLHGATPLLLEVGVPLIVADVAQCFVNAALIAAVRRVNSGVPMQSQILKLLSTMGTAYIGYGVIGFLFVVLWIPAQVGWFSAVLVLAPLFVARWAFVQYGEEVAAHERALDALVTAVEIKDPHSAGHGARVAQLCEWIAEALGEGFKEIQDVRTAGMLHDLGKVAVPTRLLRSRRDLTDDELVLLGDHALESVEMLQEIDFIRDSHAAIAHHHERFDGRGYPAGLSGEQIPLGARIIAVADAFDALTTERSYRPALTTTEALRALERRGGAHLDPQVVAALGRALHRHEWTPTVPDRELLATAGVAVDHDDPDVSDLFASRPDLRQRIKGAVVAGATEPHRTTAGRA